MITKKIEKQLRKHIRQIGIKLSGELEGRIYEESYKLLKKYKKHFDTDDDVSYMEDDIQNELGSFVAQDIGNQFG